MRSFNLSKNHEALLFLNETEVKYCPERTAKNTEMNCDHFKNWSKLLNFVEMGMIKSKSAASAIKNTNDANMYMLTWWGSMVSLDCTMLRSMMYAVTIMHGRTKMQNSNV